MQKYEKGINRVGASRLHQISRILQIPITSFFDVPTKVAVRAERAPSPFADVEAFAASREGRALAKAFVRIGKLSMRRRIVALIVQIDAAKS
jgi:hypothetical protein